MASIVHAIALLCSLAGEPTEAQLADAVTLGGLAALAPLCGLRDEAWALDLRRAAIGSTTGADAHDDAGIRSAPGSALAASALSFAEAEALEDFAAAPPAHTCGPLAQNPTLPRADAMVRAFRAGPGS